MPTGTPGPWTPGDDGGCNVNNIYAGRNVVAQVFGIPLHCSMDDLATDMDRFSEGLANARLIAAAPVLLGVLQGIVDERVGDRIRFAEDTDTDYFMRYIASIKNACRAAIALAKATQP